jgi:hypothetical protein
MTAIANNYSNYTVDNYGSPNSLTGESLMIWLSIKLDAVDSELNGMLNVQTEKLKQKEVYQQYKQLLTKMKNDGSAEAREKALKDFKKYADSLAGTSQGDRAQGWYDKAVGLKGATSGQLDIKITDITNRIEKLDKDSEIQMIKVNQLMSQRQTIVQLAQSIMNKLNETIEGIVKKFG